MINQPYRIFGFAVSKQRQFLESRDTMKMRMTQRISLMKDNFRIWLIWNVSFIIILFLLNETHVLASTCSSEPLGSLFVNSNFQTTDSWFDDFSGTSCTGNWTSNGSAPGAFIGCSTDSGYSIVRLASTGGIQQGFPFLWRNISLPNSTEYGWEIRFRFVTPAQFGTAALLVGTETNFNGQHIQYPTEPENLKLRDIHDINQLMGPVETHFHSVLLDTNGTANRWDGPQNDTQWYIIRVYVDVNRQMMRQIIWKDQISSSSEFSVSVNSNKVPKIMMIGNPIFHTEGSTFWTEVRVDYIKMFKWDETCDTTDTDNDGLTDIDEQFLGTDPNDPDTDDDGLSDSYEIQNYDPKVYTVGLDTDPNDPDTDHGGVNDGQEVMVNKTDPLDGSDDLDTSNDTDNDGLTDSTEIQNGDPKKYEEGIDTDPNDDDTDDDGLKDGIEIQKNDPNSYEEEIDTNPLDPDTDGDGLTDGDEISQGSPTLYDVGKDTDPLDPDTDNDGLSDGIEIKFDDPNSYNPEVDTNPLDPDTDDGGVNDGDEVVNQKTDPLDPSDDNKDDKKESPSQTTDDTDNGNDRDSDGLDDDTEKKIGTDPNLKDTDGDGLNDGDEISQGDPKKYDAGIDTDPLDHDTDNDGLVDGNETGKGDPKKYDAGIDTNPLDPDTDDGGVNDGVEVMVNSTNPLDGSDDGVKHTIDPNQIIMQGSGIACNSLYHHKTTLNFYPFFFFLAVLILRKSMAKL